MLRPALLAVLLFAPPAAEAGTCRQALALGLDVSGSVDAAEYRLQLDGLAGALTSPEVERAMLGGAAAPVRLLVYEWSGPAHQRIVADWTEITGAGVLDGFAARLRATSRAPAPPSTALGAALAAGGALLAGQAECWQRTLDISGDGMSNTGPRPQDLATPALDGVTVNALAILTGDAGTRADGTDLAGYFEAYVIRGPGAFVEQAAGFADYERAMARKLLRELEGIVVGAAQ